MSNQAQSSTDPTQIASIAHSLYGDLALGIQDSHSSIQPDLNDLILFGLLLVCLSKMPLPSLSPRKSYAEAAATSLTKSDLREQKSNMTFLMPDLAN